jgi:hypothetical protein
MPVVFKCLENVSRVASVVMGNETLTDNQGAMLEDDDPKFAALIAESEPSASEYKEGTDKSESDAEPSIGSASEEGPDLESEDPDTRIRLKAGKKQKKGVIARDQISAAVAAINEEPIPFVDSGKTAGSKSHQTPGYDFPI